MIHKINVLYKGKYICENIEGEKWENLNFMNKVE